MLAILQRKRKAGESKKASDSGKSKGGNGVGEGVCSWCCHANEGGAAAMLTNSNSHCWTHHLLMLYSSLLPTSITPSHLSLSLPLSLPIPLSPALARISLFLFALSLAVARAHALT